MSTENKSPRPLRAALDCEHYPITDRHTRSWTVHNVGLKNPDRRTDRWCFSLANGQTDRQTDGTKRIISPASQSININAISLCDKMEKNFLLMLQHGVFPQETYYTEDHVMRVDSIMEINHCIILSLISHVIALSIIKTSILPAGL